MNLNKKIMVSIVWIVLGALLVGLAFAGMVDSFWNGMGSALLIVGILQILRWVRFNKNESYREKVEVEQTDERQHFIRNKAWAWTGYCFVIVAAVACIVLKIVDQELLSMAASGAVCIMLVLYWGAYMILKRKY